MKIKTLILGVVSAIGLGSILKREPSYLKDHPRFREVESAFRKKHGYECSVYAHTSNYDSEEPRIWRATSVNKRNHMSYSGSGWGIDKAIDDLIREIGDKK